MRPRICVLTAGHLATTPRMVKVADALAEEGYDVGVVSTQFMDWGDEGDRSIVASRWTKWRWTTVDYRKRHAFPRYLWSGARRRAAQETMRVRGLNQIGFATAVQVRERFLSELITAAIRTRPTFIYGGGGALGATSIAAQRAGVPFAIDLEDFHSTMDPPGRYDGVTEKIERLILPKASFLTGGSTAIADAYREKYGVDVIPIHNVFSLPVNAPVPRKWDGKLRLYWFGQMLGPGRGMEETIRAVGLAGIESELGIRGMMSEEYLDSLRTLAARAAPRLSLAFYTPAGPDDMVDLCRPHDVGIAMEQPERYNQELALTNKSLTYILAGLAVAMSDTIGQRQLGADLGEGALLCPTGNVDILASGLKRWSQEPGTLERAMEAAWTSAKTRWHWSHRDERGKLIETIRQAVG
jgi:hypothetical protein